MGGRREGEIVQVQGGHIIRATGRKDRHSKVFTAKGPRDRRVRLSAHTAIQFYDVQDRLGYDRPSKAVDWLMKKAKSAIDKLAELPPFDPVAGPSSAVNVADVAPVDLGGQSESSRYEIGQFHHQQGEAGNPMGFHGYPHQDLCLSLQSFQNPGLDPDNPNSSHALFPAGFEAGPSSGGGGEHWAPPETNLGEMGHFSRLLAWSGASGGGGGGVGLGYGAGDRGTLQSNFNPPQSIRAWDDLPMGATSDDHRIPKAEMQGGLMHHHHQQPQPMAAPGIGILGSDGFMGYCVPAQMQGGGEDVHSITVAYHQNSASSMSTDSSR